MPTDNHNPVPQKGAFGEPFSIDKFGVLTDRNGDGLGIICEEVRPRVLACTNALAGLNPDALEGLVEAVRNLIERVESGSNHYDELILLRAALEKLEARP